MKFTDHNPHQSDSNVEPLCKWNINVFGEILCATHDALAAKETKIF